MAQYKKYFPFIFCLILIIIALIYSWPFFKPGYFVTDDGNWAVIRLAEMVRELKDYQIPPRWSDFLNHGFGYPLFTFVYPFPFYLAAGLKFVGLSYVVSIKFLFVLSVVLSALFMFLFINLLQGPLSAFIASLFYITSPYFLTDLYIRGSLGESLSFALFPLIFYLTLKFNKNPTLALSTLLSVSISLLLISHNVMALFFIPVWLIFVLYFDKKNHFNFLKIFILALSLSAYFIIPALVEKKYIYLSKFKLADSRNYFLTPVQLFTNLTAFQIAAIIFSLFNLKRNHYFFFLIFFIFFLFLTQKISLPLWFLPPLNIVDFPFRAFALGLFFAAVLTSYLVRNKLALIIGLFLALLSVIGNFPNTFPKNFFQKNDSFYFTNDATTTSMDELTPVWVKKKPKNRPLEKVEITKGLAQLSELSFDSKSINFRLDAETPAGVRINTIYFPGWSFKANGKDLPLDYSNEMGLITLSLPQGAGHISGRFTETPIRLFSDILSLLAAVFMISRLIYDRKI